jgi:hypothetical protein
MIKTRSLYLLAMGCILLASLVIVMFAIQTSPLAQDASNYFLQLI